MLGVSNQRVDRVLHTPATRKAEGVGWVESPACWAQWQVHVGHSRAAPVTSGPWLCLGSLSVCHCVHSLEESWQPAVMGTQGSVGTTAHVPQTWQSGVPAQGIQQQPSHTFCTVSCSKTNPYDCIKFYLTAHKIQLSWEPMHRSLIPY